MTLIDKNFLKLSKICPSCLSRYEHLHYFVQVHFKISVNICINPREDSDYELESRLLKSENRFHAQHLLPRAVDKLTDDHVATICEAYQADIYLSLEDFRREVARWRTHWVQSVVGKSLRLVMTQWVRHLATSLLKSSNDK
jgi:hypothetical protein